MKIETRAWNGFARIPEGAYFLQPDGTILVFNPDTGQYSAESSYEAELYTGLKDKNGTKVFAGDIVTTPRAKPGEGSYFKRGVIVFRQEAFWICNVPPELPNWTHSETLLGYCEADIEVLGNIHENPEMLGLEAK